MSLHDLLQIEILDNSPSEAKIGNKTLENKMVRLL